MIAQSCFKARRGCSLSDIGLIPTSFFLAEVEWDRLMLPMERTTHYSLPSLIRGQQHLQRVFLVWRTLDHPTFAGREGRLHLANSSLRVACSHPLSLLGHPVLIPFGGWHVVFS
ncbi:hypothetical protein IE53DRAFT_52918 [Violaceomyces palustris]|uniref:Uncharacterized protein n=1 Tax=Violaceomyces palustris TaxID=1673888 RepID=A0ACD0NZZ7_9BASI|nr:hypothetical protein IE53DRAFT_52918 [Violaceomyces palustris]